MADKILVIDNYDSFTYNLVHLINELTDTPVDVYRNDQISIDAVEAYDIIVLSPGPGIPDEAGKLKEIIEAYAPSKKILGVCLGQQAIAEVFGCTLKNLDEVFHGVDTEMTLTNTPEALFTDIPSKFKAGRYHSWVIDRKSMSDNLLITCIDDYDEVMGIKHRDYDVYAIQFHPESVLTPLGNKMMSNFLTLC